MTVAEAAIVAALQACAAQHPVVLEAPAHRVLAHARTEAGKRFHQFAIGVNEDKRRRLPAESHYPATEAEAVALARRLLAEGRRIDVGLMGLTDRAHARAEPGSQWAAYGLDLSNVFKVRENVCAGARILGEAYQRVVHVRAACIFNSGAGDCRRPSGTNGYPEKVQANVAPPLAAPAASPPPEPARPATSDIFVRRRLERGLPADPPRPEPTPSARGSGPAAVASLAPGNPFAQ